MSSASGSFGRCAARKSNSLMGSISPSAASSLHNTWAVFAPFSSSTTIAASPSSGKSKFSRDANSNDSATRFESPVFTGTSK